MPAKFRYEPLSLPAMPIRVGGEYTTTEEREIIRAGLAVLAHERLEPNPSPSSDRTYQDVLHRYEAAFSYDCETTPLAYRASSPTVAAQLRSAIRRASFSFISGLLQPIPDDHRYSHLSADEFELLYHHIEQYVTFQRVRSAGDYAVVGPHGWECFRDYKVTSKRDQLPTDWDWREKVWIVAESARGNRDGGPAPSRYLDGIALAWLTGARPAEIEMGVLVSYHAGELRLHVRGLKGHVDRRISWADDANAATQYLYRTLHEADTDMELFWAPSAVGLTHAIADFGGGAYPDRRPARRRKPSDRTRRAPPLCTMSYRHQLVSDVRRAGFSELSIAALLGERQARTTYIYGRSRRGKLGAALPLSISADTLAAGTRAESWHDRRLILADDNDDFSSRFR